MDYLYSLYDALVSINVPGDKARAVVDAMERDMGTTLATKVDLQILRQEVENRLALVTRDIASLRTDMTREFEAVRKEMGFFRSDMTRDMEALRGGVAKDMENLRSDMARDLEALRLSMTIRLGSMLLVGFGTTLAALRLWL